MKEITHDEARALVVWRKGSKLFDYITQQEKKDELLELYRSAIKGCPSHIPLGILKEIEKSESELK